MRMAGKIGLLATFTAVVAAIDASLLEKTFASCISAAAVYT